MTNASKENVLGLYPQIGAGILVELDPRDMAYIDNMLCIRGTTAAGETYRVPVVLGDDAPDVPVYDQKNGVCYMAPAIR